MIGWEGQGNPPSAEELELYARELEAGLIALTSQLTTAPDARHAEEHAAIVDGVARIAWVAKTCRWSSGA